MTLGLILNTEEIILNLDCAPKMKEFSILKISSGCVDNLTYFTFEIQFNAHSALSRQRFKSHNSGSDSEHGRNHFELRLRT